ncbi:hypothetical protein, partial [Pseudobutyrivibrio ruminis]|uniref:hypothetical protein n=1 Tax=Pseudobutyrivibrio ruminis TaxID=46206 RepID=UPI0026E95D92
ISSLNSKIRKQSSYLNDIAAVLAAAAHPYQISLFVLLNSFQNRPKVTIVLEIHIYTTTLCPSLDIQIQKMYRPAKDTCKLRMRALRLRKT